MNRRVLVCGWYGSGNVGDEALLGQIISDLTKLGIPRNNIKATSESTQHTREYHGIDCIQLPPLSFRGYIKWFLKFGNFSQLIKDIREADILVLGGGGFLADQNMFSTVVWMHFVLLAKLFDKKIVVYGIGAGPFIRWHSKYLIPYSFKHLHNILVRDDESKKRLLQLGIKDKQVKVTGDSVIRFDENHSKDVPSSVKKRTRVGFVIHPYQQLKNEKIFNGYYNLVMNIIATLIETDIDIVLMPFQKDPDHQFCLEVAEQFPLNQIEIPIFNKLEDVLDAMTSVDLLISSRLHGSIISAALGLPFYSINYHYKSYEFCKKLEWEYFFNYSDGENLDFQDENEADITEILGYMLSNLEKLKETLKTKTEQYRAQEKGNYEVLAEAIGMMK